MHSRNFLLFQAFLRREITNRYVGSASGVLWALASPLAQLAAGAVQLPPAREVGARGIGRRGRKGRSGG